MTFPKLLDPKGCLTSVDAVALELRMVPHVGYVRFREMDVFRV